MLINEPPIQYTGIAMVLTLFGKSTHISMISNSVTHLRSYTNSAIADIAGNSAHISPETPRERRCLRIQRRERRIEWRLFQCFVMLNNVLRVFHDISQCFTSGALCFTALHDVLRRYTMCHNVLQVFHDVLLCLTTFYDV